MSFLAYLHRSADRESLSFDEAREAMGVLLEGRASPALVAAFLVALRMKGETAEEVAGFASAMREHMVPMPLGPGEGAGLAKSEAKASVGSGTAAMGGRGDVIVDTCGTGGDSLGTFNVSTVTAFVMAGAGARVAKHGNRSISSASGSADVLEALGIAVTSSPEQAAMQLETIGMTFLFAPAFHPAMRHVQPVRRELKLRTVFNLLGPLANPAGAQAQVIGAPSVASAKLMAEALHHLGTRRSFVVHGDAGNEGIPGIGQGMDEISVSGPTEVFEVTAQGVLPHVWRPADFGVIESPIEMLIGGDALQNAQIALGILAGDRGAKRDIVVVNAAAGLLACGLARDLRGGAQLAAKSIDTGAARQKLEQLRLASPASDPWDQAQIV